mmetsp:Transcript_44555/g.78821  ORF Transcript_44555/g.78821 Transcript_44555/m.78821 type:complete len:200 (+) Transcript_44555:82-681(+)
MWQVFVRLFHSSLQPISIISISSPAFWPSVLSNKRTLSGGPAFFFLHCRQEHSSSPPSSPLLHEQPERGNNRTCPITRCAPPPQRSQPTLRRPPPFPGRARTRRRRRRPHPRLGLAAPRLALPPLAHYYLRRARRSARVCAWKPARICATHRLDPQSWQCTKKSRETWSRVSVVLAARHIWQVTYSTMYLRSRLSMYLG